MCVSLAGSQSKWSRGESGRRDSRTDCKLRWEAVLRVLIRQLCDLIAVAKAYLGCCIERKFKVKGVYLTGIQLRITCLTHKEYRSFSKARVIKAIVISLNLLLSLKYFNRVTTNRCFLF